MIEQSDESNRAVRPDLSDEAGAIRPIIGEVEERSGRNGARVAAFRSEHVTTAVPVSMSIALEDEVCAASRHFVRDSHLGAESRLRRANAARPPGRKEESRMATARLRVFPHPEDESLDEPGAPNVTIRLSDLYPLLAQAYRDNYVWLRDFEDEPILVTPDLQEIVRAFSNCRPSA